MQPKLLVTNVITPEGKTNEEVKEIIEKFVSASLDITSLAKGFDTRFAIDAFVLIIQSWQRSNVHINLYASQFMEAGVSIANKYNLPMGELLAGINQFLTLVPPTQIVSTNPSTTDRIINAAYTIFAEKGFYNTTIDEIAAHAEIGKGTIYRYFESKDALFQEVVKSKLLELTTHIRIAFDSTSNLLDAIRFGCAAYLRFFQTHKTFYRILVFEQQSYGSKFRAEYITEILERVSSIREKVIQASVAGQTKKLHDFYTVVYGMIGFMDGVIHKWFYNDCNKNLEDELDTIIEVFFYGFVNPDCESNVNTSTDS